MGSSSLLIAAIVLTGSLNSISSVDSAESLHLTINDTSGNPVNNAVISAYSHNKSITLHARPLKTVIIDQINKKFVPHVTPVEAGTAVIFPNHDQIRHHVYSFSPAKAFEIPLYKGIPDEPVVFEQQGVVVLGCNIHDWMSAYIVVIDSPYFATTDAHGRTSLTLPAGDYELRFWHPDADEQSKKRRQTIQITVGQAVRMEVELDVKPFWSSGQAPLLIQNRGRYR